MALPSLLPANLPWITLGNQNASGANNDPYKIAIQMNQGTQKSVHITGWLPESVSFDASAQYEAPFASGLSGMFPFNLVGGNLLRALGVSLITQVMTAQVWQGSSEIEFSLPIIFQAEADSVTEVIGPIKQLLKMIVPNDPTGGGLLEAPGPHIDIDKLKSSVNAALSPLDPLYGQTVTQVKSAIAGGSASISGYASQGTTAWGRAVTAYGSAKSLMHDAVSSPLSLATSAASGLKNLANKGLVAMTTPILNAIVNNISVHIGSWLYFPAVVITSVSQDYDVLITPDGNPGRVKVNVTFKTFFTPTQQDVDFMYPAAQTDAALAGTTIT